MSLVNSKHIAEEINVALKEYDIMHQKVFANAKRIESQVVQLYLITAGVLSICIPRFSTGDPGLKMLIDILMVYLLPFLFFASVISTLVLELRTLYHGQYLSVIEKRVNVLLGYTIGFDSKSDKNSPLHRIMDYERYRIKFGHRKRTFSTNADFIMFTLAYAMIVMPAAVIRLTHASLTPLYFYIFIFATLFEIIFTVIMSIVFKTESDKLKLLVESVKVEYDLGTKDMVNDHAK